MGPLMGTNKAAWGVKLLLMTVSAYQVDCGCFCAILNTQLELGDINIFEDDISYYILSRYY